MHQIGKQFQKTTIPMNECRRGTRHSVDGTGYKDTLVEVGVEVGLMTIVNVKFRGFFIMGNNIKKFIKNY